MSVRTRYIYKVIINTMRVHCESPARSGAAGARSFASQPELSARRRTLRQLAGDDTAGWILSTKHTLWYIYIFMCIYIYVYRYKLIVDGDFDNHRISDSNINNKKNFDIKLPAESCFEKNRGKIKEAAASSSQNLKKYSRPRWSLKNILNKTNCNKLIKNYI